MPRVFVNPWRTETEASSFPFVSTLSAVSDTDLPFPVAGVLDASFYAAVDTLYLSSVVIDDTGLATLWVGTADEPQLAYAEFAAPYTSEVLEFVDTYGRQFGVIVINTTILQTLAAWSVGTHSFATELEFVVSTLLPLPSAVEGVLLDDGTLLRGDVWLVGEDGVVVRHIDGNIRIDIVGDPLFKRRLCSDSEEYSTPRFLKTISSISPNAHNDFTITVGQALAADSILRIVPGEDGESIWIGLVGQTTEGESI